MNSLDRSASGPTRQLRAGDLKRHLSPERLQTLSVVALFLVLLIAFAVADSDFLTVTNLSFAGRAIAPTMIVAVAMTFVITAGGIDLSVGSLLAVTGSSVALMAQNLGAYGSLGLTLVIGLASGLLMGYLSAYHGIQPFIVTLAALTALRGIAELITQGYSTAISSGPISYLGQGKVGGIYVCFWLALVVAAIGWYIFTQTAFGRYVVGVGSNAEAVRRAGVNIKRVRTLTFVGTGLAAALAGIITVARLGSGSSNIGVAFELEVITAVVLGGTSLMGGRGSIWGAIFGALTLGILNNGLVLMGLDVYWVPIIQGMVLVVAIFVNVKVFGRFSTQA